MRTRVRRPNPLLPTNDIETRAARRTFAGRFAVALAVGALFVGAGTGCDRSKALADREVQRTIDEASANLGAGDAAKAVTLLEKAAGNAAASTAMQIQAKAQLATAQLAAGGEASRRWSARSADAVRLIHEIELLAIRINIGNTMAAGYRALEPKEIQADNQARVAAATGGANAPSFGADAKGEIKLPTLAFAKQEVSRLQADIAKRKSEVDALEKEQQAARAKADELQRAADSAQGQAVLSTYKQASDQRKVASDLGAQVDNKRAQITPVEQELAVAEAQQKVIEGYIAALGNQAKQRQAGWSKLQEQVAAQQAVNKAIVDGKGAVATEASIQPKADALDKALDESKALKDEAETLLGNAVKNFDEAATLAETLRRDLRAGGNKSGFDDQVTKAYTNAYDPAYYKMQKGIAQTELAGLYAAEATTIAARAQMLKNLKEATTAAGIQTSGKTDADAAAKDAHAAHAKADAAYKEATDTLAAASESVLGTDQRGNHAKMAQIFALYGWAKLQAASGQRDAAQKNVQAAVVIRDGLLQGDVPASSIVLPAELTPPPKMPVTPTTAPAAPAAPGAATPAAPADGTAAPAAPGAAPANPATPPAGTPATPANPEAAPATPAPAAPAAPTGDAAGNPAP